MCVQTEPRVVQGWTLLPIAHEGTLRERPHADQLVDLCSCALQTRQIVLSPGEDLLQDRHEGTVSERTDSVVRLQHAAVPRRDQLQRRVRMYERYEGRRQMREGRQRRLRKHAGHGEDQQNVLQAVHAGTVYRGRVVSRSENAEKRPLVAEERVAAESQMRMPAWLQEDR